MDKILIESLLYDERKDIFDNIMKITDVSNLYSFMFNYNWSDGFEIPKAVIENKNCDLSTALLVFYLVEGQVYLEDKNAYLHNKELHNFIVNLYEMVIIGKYKKSEIAFKVPLTKVQKYKLKKIIQSDELIFLEDIDGESFNISI